MCVLRSARPASDPPRGIALAPNVLLAVLAVPSREPVCDDSVRRECAGHWTCQHQQPEAWSAGRCLIGGVTAADLTSLVETMLRPPNPSVVPLGDDTYMSPSAASRPTVPRSRQALHQFRLRLGLFSRVSFFNYSRIVVTREPFAAVQAFSGRAIQDIDAPLVRRWKVPGGCRLRPDRIARFPSRLWRSPPVPPVVGPDSTLSLLEVHFAINEAGGGTLTPAQYLII